MFAAGDICEYDSVVHGGAPVRIEHWDVAFNHGKTAALNMLGSDVAPRRGPLLLLRARPTGANSSTSARPTSGTRRSCAARSRTGSFTNWYLKDGVVKAALTVGRSDDLDDARRLIVRRTPLDEAERRGLADRDADLDRIAR